jgi:hypothetical protein
MKTPPIAFTQDNFSAVLSGLKTETRRLLTLKGRTQEEVNEITSFCQDGDGNWVGHYGNTFSDLTELAEFTKKAYPKGCNKGIKSKYQIGDRCYLTEPTQILNTSPDDSIDIESCEVAYFWGDKVTTYEGISDRRWIDLTDDDAIKICNRKSGVTSKQIARFMLKSFARYWVEIVDVRVERLLDITVKAAIREGIKEPLGDAYTPPECLLWWDYTYEDYILPDPRTSYLSEIAYIHKSTKDKIGGWDLVKSNPWLWVYEFKLVGTE